MSPSCGERNQHPSRISLGILDRIWVLQLELAEACRIHAHREKTTETTTLFWSSMFLTIQFVWPLQLAAGKTSCAIEPRCPVLSFSLRIPNFQVAALRFELPARSGFARPVRGFRRGWIDVREVRKSGIDQTVVQFELLTLV